VALTDPAQGFGIACGTKVDPRLALEFRPSQESGGYGIYGELLTRSFSDVRVGAGLQAMPNWTLFVAPSMGAYVRPSSEGRWRPALTAGALIGFNVNFDQYEDRVVLRRSQDVGLRIDIATDLTGARDKTILLGLQGDPVPAIQLVGFLLFMLFGGRSSM
jgi:hypothetical protein